MYPPVRGRSPGRRLCRLPRTRARPGPGISPAPLSSPGPSAGAPAVHLTRPQSKEADMVRKGLCAVLCGGVLLCAALPLGAGPGDEAEVRLRNNLAVQAAFEQGLGLL